MQCIEGSFADDKTMTGMTYNLQLCLPTVCLRRRSEDPSTNVAHLEPAHRGRDHQAG